MTLTTPFLLMILHLSHIFFTDDRTFIIYLKAIIRWTGVARGSHPQATVRGTGTARDPSLHIPGHMHAIQCASQARSADLAHASRCVFAPIACIAMYIAMHKGQPDGRRPHIAMYIAMRKGQPDGCRPHIAMYIATHKGQPDGRRPYIAMCIVAGIFAE